MILNTQLKLSLLFLALWGCLQWQVPCMAERPHDLIFNKYPNLGWSLYVAKPSLRKMAALPHQAKGLMIVNVAEKTPAAFAGIQAGDLLTQVNGMPVKEWEEKLRKTETVSYEPLMCQIQRKQELLQFTIKPVPAESIHSGEFARIRQQTAYVLHLIEDLRLSLGRYGSMEEFLQAKHRVREFYQQLQQEAMRNNKPLYAEKFRLLAEEFR